MMQDGFVRSYKAKGMEQSEKIISSETLDKGGIIDNDTLCF
jgi:hypothetical protein